MSSNLTNKEQITTIKKSLINFLSNINQFYSFFFLKNYFGTKTDISY